MAMLSNIDLKKASCSTFATNQGPSQITDKITDEEINFILENAQEEDHAFAGDKEMRY